MVDFLQRFGLLSSRIQVARLGFTLIEVLVVIAIVGLLASAVAIAINPTKRIAQTNDAQRKSDLGSIARALQVYQAEKEVLADPGSDLQADSTEGPDWIPSLRPDYLKTLPKDPKQAGIMGSLAVIFSEEAGKLNGKVLGIAQINKGFYTQPLLDDSLQAGQFLSSVDWVDLEPSPGVYDFSKIDNAVAPAAAAGKRVRLKIGGGGQSPLWLRADPYSIPTYHVIPPNSSEYDTPYMWHPTYVARLTEFLTALGQYLDSPSFSYRSTIAGVTVPGGGSLPAY